MRIESQTRASVECPANGHIPNLVHGTIASNPFRTDLEPWRRRCALRHHSAVRWLEAHQTGVPSSPLNAGGAMRKATANQLVACGVLFLVAVLRLPAAHAQSPAVAPGDRIRVTTTESFQLIGTLSAMSPDSLELTTEEREVRIPLNMVERFEVSTGQKRNTGKGALIGLAVGGLALGLASLAADGESECAGGDLCFDFPPPGVRFVIGGVLGGLIGAGVGALIGRSSRSDRWERVSVETSLGLLQPHPTAMRPVPALRVRVGLP